MSAEITAGVALATPKELSALAALRSCPWMILCNAELTGQPELSERETEHVLKQGPNTVPGEEMKVKTALKRLSGVGFRTASSKASASLDSSRDHSICVASFHVDVA